MSRFMAGPACTAIILSIGMMASASSAAAGVNEDGNGPTTSPGHYMLTCWQHGVKIVDHKNLANLQENPAAGQKPIQLTDRGKDGLTVQIYNLGDTLCQVQGTP
ncbi:MAG: hypothetical protein HQL87_03480 [Magnetococcales bacterium]|nr:hypothetical protein [Magnetococcales bacterium]